MFRWIALAAPSAALATPVQLGHSGRLLDGLGSPVAGPSEVVVGLFALESGGAPIFSDTFADLPLADGYYSVLLGAAVGNSLDSSLLVPPLWVGVSIGGTPLLPRQPVVQVPFAANASGGTAGSAPSITGVSPGVTTSAGGGTFTVSGSGFTAGSTVRIGPTPAASVVYVNSTTLTVTAPPGNSGLFAVKVANPGGAFDILPESIAYASPDVPFGYTGVAQSWAVPAGVTSITARAWGGGGGAGGHPGDGGTGGGGGYAKATLAVTPGTTLTIYVGGLGNKGAVGASGSPSAGGWGYGVGGGGGTSNSDATGGGGGGGSAIVNQAGDVLLVAGGGGGGGGYVGDGGAGGGTNGAQGTTSSQGCTGGSGGDQASSGINGQAGVGVTSAYPSGGGGGGWEGGAYGSHNCGWDRGGAGGGSGRSHPSLATAAVLETGAARVPGGLSDPKYPGSPTGYGGNTNAPTNGNVGHVVLTY